jgi:hypothetical protein
MTVDISSEAVVAAIACLPDMPSTYCASHDPAGTMPIRVTVYHPDRIIIGVASGEIGVQDLGSFLREIVGAGVRHYRKIIDVAGATPVLSQEELASFTAGVRATYGKTPTGPLAIVAHSRQSDLARMFAQLTGTDRPAEVFRSIHDARRWLATMPIVQPP